MEDCLFRGYKRVNFAGNLINGNSVGIRSIGGEVVYSENVSDLGSGGTVKNSFSLWSIQIELTGGGKFTVKGNNHFGIVNRSDEWFSDYFTGFDTVLLITLELFEDCGSGNHSG